MCEIIEKAMSSDSEIMSISCGGGCGGEWEEGEGGDNFICDYPRGEVSDGREICSIHGESKA